MSFIYWLYLWQLKEYRIDRMLIYLRELSMWQLLLEYIVGKPWKRPVLTVKSLLVSGTSVVVTIVLILLFTILEPVPYTWWFVILYVLLSPIGIAMSVQFWQIPTIYMEKRLMRRAKEKMKMLPHVKVIGITGSYGKTSTKEVVAHVLSTHFNVEATPRSVNNEIGIARFILNNVDNSTEVLIVEMGAYFKGVVKNLSDMVEPDVGILTGITEQHLALFGNLQNIIETKFELIDALPGDGLAVLNVANVYIQKGKSRAHSNLKEYEAHNALENESAARIVASYLGMNKDEIERSFHSWYGTENRSQLRSGKHGVLIIDDTFNSNDVGICANIDLAISQGREHVLLITTGVYELGDKAQEVHKRIEDYALERGVNIIVVERQHVKYFSSALYRNTTESLKDAISGYVNGDSVIIASGRSLLIKSIIKDLYVR